MNQPYVARTQSAMLEAMQEQRVSVMGDTHQPEPFWCITQNPIDMEGTYPLPEAHGPISVQIASQSTLVLSTIIQSRRRGRAPTAESAFAAGEIAGLFGLVERSFFQLRSPI